MQDVSTLATSAGHNHHFNALCRGVLDVADIAYYLSVIVFMLAAAQTGIHADGRGTYGHSLIIDPWGKVLADAGTDIGVVTAEIDTALVTKARYAVPALTHDRSFTKPQPRLSAAGE